MGAADTTFGDIEIAIRSEFKATRIIETRGEYGNGGHIVAGATMADAGDGSLTRSEQEDEAYGGKAAGDKPFV
jgi:hypothetical protein